MGSLVTIGVTIGTVFAKTITGGRRSNMIVQEKDLVEGKWYVVQASGPDQYRAISKPFDTYYEACHGGSSAEYPDDVEIRRWTGTNWEAVKSNRVRKVKR